MQTQISLNEKVRKQSLPKGEQIEPKVRKKMISKMQKKISLVKSTKNWKWPDDYIKKLPNLWEGEDSAEWLRKKRDSWDD